MKKLMVVAGGTGGHIFPGLAVAEYLQQQGWQICWMGTADRMEAQLVPKHGFAIEFINVKGVRGNGLLRKLSAPLMVLKAIGQARRIMKVQRPDVVLSMGGYVTGPAVLAAKLLGIKTVLHEQNAIPGFTNKLLSKWVDRVLVAFDGTFPFAAKELVTGNPIRQSVMAQQPAQSLHTPLRILVVGGSLGARVFNEHLPAMFAKLQQQQAVSVRHQSGKGNAEALAARYAEQQCEAQVQEFIDDMDAAYRWADLVICRAGALTVSELAAAGKAAVFVPFPQAVDDHQTENAQWLVAQQAAVLLPQSEFVQEAKALHVIENLLADPQQLLAMAQRAHALAKVNATADVAQHCIELANG